MIQFNISIQTHNITILFVDKEKYREMTLDAAETVLGFFGFDRSAYSNLKRNNGKKRKWRWYEELREQRVTDIEAEMRGFFQRPLANARCSKSLGSFLGIIVEREGSAVGLIRKPIKMDDLVENLREKLKPMNNNRRGNNNE